MGAKGETRNVWTVILLTLVTCNIYGAYWIYKSTKEMNAYLGEEKINPTLAAVLVFVPFGILYDYYIINDAMKAVRAKAGLQQNDNFILWLILYFVAFSVFVCEYQVQTELNEVWAAPNYVG